MKAASEPAWLSRALRPFTEVRDGEAVTVLLLTFNVFLLLSAYYVIKPVREGLILAMESGAEYKAYMSGVIAALLLGLVPLYGKLVDRLPRVKLVIGVSLAFAVQLLLFFVALGVPSVRERLGLVFYVWVGVFNMMVVAQFWAYANDLYDKEQGKRLFPMIALGASVGAAVGSRAAQGLFGLLGVAPMLIIAAALLAACSAIFWLVERRKDGSGEAAAQDSRDAPPAAAAAPRGGFTLVIEHRYLLLLAAFSLVFNWVNTNGEYMLGKIIKEEATAAVASGQIQAADVGRFIGAAYAKFFFGVNVLGVFLQSFVVSRVVKWLGLPRAFLFMPLLALGNALVVAFLPIVALVKAGKATENATDYSLNNTLRQVLWLVTTPEMKYKAKQAVDTFFVRMGDLCSALSVWLLASVLHLPVRRFAWMSVALTGIWIALALLVGRTYRRLESGEESLSA